MARRSPPADPNELMCTWPPTGRPQVRILKGDFHRSMVDNGWLNDTIIDWGIKVAWALEQRNNPNLENDVYIFNSFLYQKLTDEFTLRAGFDPWENVKSWTTKKVGKGKRQLKVDLFAKKFIVVPINESHHWYFAIVVNPRAVFQPPPAPWHEASKAQERQQGYVLVFNSLGNRTRTNPAKVLSRYLRSEGVEHQGWPSLDPTCLTTLELKRVDVPQQPDQDSCGIFLLHYIEIFLRDPEKAVEFIFAQERPEYYEYRTDPDWLAALGQYINERDAFWASPELATKRAGYKRKLLRLEQEYLAYKHGHEPPPEEQEPVSDSETAVQTGRSPQTGLEALTDTAAASATADSAAACAPQPAAEPSVADAPAEATFDKSDVTPPHALITSTRTPEEIPFEEPILPPSPSPEPSAYADVPHPDDDDITEEDRKAGFPPVPLLLPPRPSQEDNALLTQSAAQTFPSLHVTDMADRSNSDGIERPEPSAKKQRTS